MADKIIPPQRGEDLTPSGKPTRRFSYYLEENSSQTNESTELTEADPASINMSSAQLSQVNKKVAELVNESLVSQAGLITKLVKRIEQLESTISNNSNSNLIKRVVQLESTTTSNNGNNKKLTQLENDFVAPFYKTRYDKLTIRTGVVRNLSAVDLVAEEVNTTGNYSVDGVQVLTNQQAAISDPLATVNSLQIAVTNILGALRTHGAIDT